MSLRRSSTRRVIRTVSLAVATAALLAACSKDGPTSTSAGPQVVALSLTAPGNVGAVVLDLTELTTAANLTVPTASSERYLALETPTAGTRRLLLIGDLTSSPILTVTYPAGGTPPTVSVREVADTANAELPTSAVTAAFRPLAPR